MLCGPVFAIRKSTLGCRHPSVVTTTLHSIMLFAQCELSALGAFILDELRASLFKYISASSCGMESTTQCQQGGARFL